MKFPTGKNPLIALHELVTTKLVFRQILDFGHYDIRMDPDQGRGWFSSKFGKGDIHAKNRQVTSNTLPTQVRLALERAGYDTRNVRSDSGS